MNKRLEFALALARLGFRIFPIRPGVKTPYGDEGWKAIRTTNETVIRQWFATRPDMNYAVNPADDQVIIDLDQGIAKKDSRVKQGIANFDALEKSLADFDEEGGANTFMVRTPRGGVHLYFKDCKEAYANSAGKLAQDVDVRGSDGYVVGPGSYTFEDPDNNTAEGEYEPDWEVGSPENVLPVPGWLARKLTEHGTVGVRSEVASQAAQPLDTLSAIERAKDVLRARKVAVQGNTGDEHTYVTACKIKDEGVSPEKCFELMTMPLFPDGRSWNEHCEPMWDDAGLTKKIANAYRYGTNQPGSRGDALGAIAEIHDIDGALEEGEYISAIPQPGAVDKPKPADVFAANAFQGSDELFGREIDTDMIAPEWLPATGYIALKARRGTGKTVFSVDLSARLACDMDWHNEVPLERDWAVVYLCGEDDGGYQLHLEAWCKAHGKKIPRDRFLTMTMAPNLMSGAQTEAMAKFIKSRLGDRKTIIFLDTWQRATSMASQNDDKEMQTAIANTDGLRKFLRGPVVIACHPPKSTNETISGAMVIENSSQCIIHIENEGFSKRVTVERIKGPGEGNFFRLSYDSVDLGRFDKHKRPVTGLVPNAGAGTGESAEVKHNREMAETRAEILTHLNTIMTDNKGHVTFKDAAAWFYEYARDNPATLVGRYGNHLHDVEDAKKRLCIMFPVGNRYRAGNGADVIADEKKIKFANDPPMPPQPGNLPTDL